MSEAPPTLPETPAPPRTWRPMLLWTAAILAAAALAWLIGTAADRTRQWRQVRGVVEGLRGRHDLDPPPTLPAEASYQGAVQELGGPERAAPRLRRYLALPPRLAPHQDLAAELLARCEVDLVAVRKFAADAADGRHDFHELARRGRLLFPEGARIPGHAEVFKSFPRAARYGNVVYTLWGGSGDKEWASITLAIDPHYDRIVRFSAIDAWRD